MTKKWRGEGQQAEKETSFIHTSHHFHIKYNNTMSSIIDEPSSDDDIPGPSGLKIVSGRKRPAPTPPTTAATTTATITNLNNNDTLGGVHSGTIVSPSPAAAAGILNRTTNVGNKKQARVATQTRPSKAYCLIWVCTHGKGRRSSWRKKDLKIMGVYPSKADAENAKRHTMSQYECCGHGDILVGGTWEDEIDLVIREAPMNL